MKQDYNTLIRWAYLDNIYLRRLMLFAFVLPLVLFVLLPVSLVIKMCTLLPEGYEEIANMCRDWYNDTKTAEEKDWWEKGNNSKRF